MTDNLRPIHLTLRYPTESVEEFSSRFGCDIAKSGLFVRSESVPELGATVAFELRLAGGASILSGRARVVWAQPAPSAELPTGWAMRFTELDAINTKKLTRILASKRGDHRAAKVWPVCGRNNVFLREGEGLEPGAVDALWLRANGPASIKAVVTSDGVSGSPSDPEWVSGLEPRLESDADLLSYLLPKSPSDDATAMLVEWDS